MLSVMHSTGQSLREVLQIPGYTLDDWPYIDSAAVPERHRATFIKRRKAVQLYAKGVRTSEICKLTGVWPAELVRLIQCRCLAFDQDGRLFGYRGLIPQLRTVPYRRSSRIVSEVFARGYTVGGFTQLMRLFPELEKALSDRILKKKHERLSPLQSREPIIMLHAWFIGQCRKLGLEESNQYPFNTKWLGYRSLAKYVKTLIENHPEQGAKARYGAEAAKRLATGSGTNTPVLRPYQRVECDAHKIDGIFCVLVPSIFGELIPKVVHRLWVIVLQDVVTRCVLGYHLSLNQECNQFDLLHAIRRSLVATTLRKLSVPGMEYVTGAGFPSARFPRFVGACWDEMSVDEAMINRCKAVNQGLRDIVGCKTIVLPRHSPNDRPFIERFFGLLEAAGFHRLPNTTGNSPTDPRRSSPAAVAVRWQFQIEQAEELLEVLCANYNATPHHSLGFRSPLDYLAFLCPETRCDLRIANPQDVRSIANIRTTATVKGGVKHGRRPYVQYLGVRYSSETLGRSHHLAGMKVTLVVDDEDLRTIHIYQENGSPLGVVQAGPPWHRVPHSIIIRKAVLSLANRKLLHLSSSTDPVIALLEYAEANLKHNKTVSPAYLEARRLLVSNLEELQDRDLSASQQTPYLEQSETAKGKSQSLKAPGLSNPPLPPRRRISQ